MTGIRRLAEVSFALNPGHKRQIFLAQWIITDDAGQQTTVILGDLTVGKSFAPGFFNIKEEIERRKN